MICLFHLMFYDLDFLDYFTHNNIIILLSCTLCFWIILISITYYVVFVFSFMCDYTLKKFNLTLFCVFVILPYNPEAL